MTLVLTSVITLYGGAMENIQVKNEIRLKKIEQYIQKIKILECALSVEIKLRFIITV